MGLIKLTNIGKVYRMGAKRELLTSILFRRRRRRNPANEFWALRGVSFQVTRGERVAIIGRNGAGKSTLLSIIAGVTAPDEGHVALSGRLSALLELGSGFHPDLTGRENAIIYASLVGLHREEIKHKLDAIIEFSELGSFSDEPLRTYSSGMIARLAFSVAIHVDPEILILDEILAVGDARFQAKCKERIDEMARSGITLLFVSHSPESVRDTCDRAIWLERGRIVMEGSVERVLEGYAAGAAQLAEQHAIAPESPEA